MSDDVGGADEFEAHRERLLAIAARSLGRRADAEDVVQEAWLRFARQEPGTVDNVAGWLTTVVGRLSIDVLRSRTAKAETTLEGPFVDLIVAIDDGGSDPETSAVHADSLGLAMLTVLDSLKPEERIAFVLHDLFALPFAEIGPIIGRSADAAKMTASRARRKVQGAGAAPVADLGQQRAVVDAFMSAAREGDFEALLDILDPNVVWEVHGARGITVRTGSHEVARAIERGRRAPAVTAGRVLVNRTPGVLVWGRSGRPASLMKCTINDGRMTRLTSLTDRARLAELDLAPSPTQG